MRKCPDPVKVRIDAFLMRDGVRAKKSMLLRSAYFDDIATALIEGETAPPGIGNLPLRSPRDYARWAYYRGSALYSKVGPPLRLGAPVFDIRDYVPNNFAHLIIDMIPLCLHAREEAGPDTIVLFPRIGRDLRARILDLLAFFGIEPLETQRRAAGPIVTVLGKRGLAPYTVRLLIDYSPLLMLPRTYDRFSIARTVSFEKVYLSRRDARAITNNDEVEKFLARHGYVPVYMEDYSIADQLSIGAHARRVVAVHGAAMAFLTMARRIESVIEIFPPHVFHDYFPLALGPRVGRYLAVVPEHDDRVAMTGWRTIVDIKNKPFAVDLGLIEEAVAEAEGAAASAP